MFNIASSSASSKAVSLSLSRAELSTASGFTSSASLLPSCCPSIRMRLGTLGATSSFSALRLIRFGGITHNEIMTRRKDAK